MSVYLHLISHNEKESIKLLLECKSDNDLLNPSINDNEAFIAACGSGHKEIVELFLADSRVDPNAQHCKALQTSCENADHEIAKLLLESPKVEPTESFGRIMDFLLGKCSYNNYGNTFSRFREIAKLIFLDPRIDQTYNSNLPIFVASSEGMLRVVKILLQNENVDFRSALMDSRPHLNRNFTIREAYRNGHLDVVHILARDSRMNVSECISDTHMRDSNIADKLQSIMKEVELERKSIGLEEDEIQSVCNPVTGCKINLSEAEIPIESDTESGSESDNELYTNSDNKSDNESDNKITTKKTKKTKTTKITKVTKTIGEFYVCKNDIMISMKHVIYVEKCENDYSFTLTNGAQTTLTPDEADHKIFKSRYPGL